MPATRRVRMNWPAVHRYEFRAMGSPCEIQVQAASTAEAERACVAMRAEIERLEARYSRYRPDSLLAAINQVGAAGGSLELDDETAALMDYAAACHAQSDGLFDISSGVLRQAWDFRSGRLPEPGTVAALLARVGWHKLVWQRPVLTLPPGMELDFGGVVKEYAADRAAGVCREHGVGHGLVNLGGDICVIGAQRDGTPWRIGVRDPRTPETVGSVVPLRAGAIASSGDYERCMLIDGVRYGHILDPKSGWPVRHLAAVTVVGPCALVAGSAATIALLKGRAGPSWLAALGLPHVWIDTRGRVGGPLAVGFGMDEIRAGVLHADGVSKGG